MPSEPGPSANFNAHSVCCVTGQVLIAQQLSRNELLFP